MKRLPAIAAALLCGCTALLSLPASAEKKGTFTDNILTYEYTDGGVNIISADTSLTEITINSNMEGYPIVGISDSAFAGQTSLQRVTIKDGLTKIDTGAFSGCTALEEIRLPETLKELGDGVFHQCSSLKEIALPDSLTEMGDYMFGYCFALETVKLPANLKKLPGYTFYYDVSLHDVAFPETMERICSMGFVNCASLTSVALPAALKDIEPAAFVSCTGIREITAEGNAAFKVDENGVLYSADGSKLCLYPAGKEGTTLQIPEGVKEIASYAVSGAAYLESVTLPKSVTQYGEGAFASCRVLNSVTLPENATEIGSSMFADCTEITEITVPQTVTAIHSYAFYRCTGLQSITLPEGLKSIGDYAFCGCTDLSELTVPAGTDTFGEYSLGFLATEASDTEAKPTLKEDFLLHVSPGSPAKTFASDNGITYKLTKPDIRVYIWGFITLVALAALICFVVHLLRKSICENREKEAAQPAPEQDPSYRSILSDDTEQAEASSDLPDAPAQDDTDPES